MTTENSVIKESEATINKEYQELVTAAKSPKSSLIMASKYGIKSFGKVIGVFLLFAFINFVCGILILSQWIYSSYTTENGKLMLIVILLGIVFTVYATTKAYRNFIFDIMKSSYKKLTPVFKKLSSSFVQNSDAIRTGEFEVKQKEIKKVLRTGGFINEQKQRLPKVLQKGVWLLLKQIPIIGMLAEIDETVRQENKEKASEELFHKMDTHIENKLLNQISFKWIFWLLPLNIIAQVYFLYYW